MQQPGPEAKELEGRAGEWDDVASFWPKSGADLMIATGLIVERKIVGLYPQEIMKPAKGSKVPDFTRIAYQTQRTPFLRH